MMEPPEQFLRPTHLAYRTRRTGPQIGASQRHGLSISEEKSVENKYGRDSITHERTPWGTAVVQLKPEFTFPMDMLAHWAIFAIGGRAGNGEGKVCHRCGCSYNALETRPEPRDR